MSQARILEAEPSQLTTLASVQVDTGAWWSGVVTVPEDNSGLALLELARHGPGAMDESSAAVLVPIAELPVLALLVSAVTANARRRPHAGEFEAVRE